MFAQNRNSALYKVTKVSRWTKWKKKRIQSGSNFIDDNYHHKLVYCHCPFDGNETSYIIQPICEYNTTFAVGRQSRRFIVFDVRLQLEVEHQNMIKDPLVIFHRKHTSQCNSLRDLHIMWKSYSKCLRVTSGQIYLSFLVLFMAPVHKRQSGSWEIDLGDDILNKMAFL